MLHVAHRRGRLRCSLRRVQSPSYEVVRTSSEAGSVSGRPNESDRALLSCRVVTARCRSETRRPQKACTADLVGRGQQPTLVHSTQGDRRAEHATADPHAER